MRSGQFDVALLPVIDYQRMDNLFLIPSGGIGCDGPTLTVRLFSKVPMSRIRSLACDTDSHTSVALARVILDQVHACRPELIPWTFGQPTHTDARLVIGDKVVTGHHQEFDHQIDLGEAWKKMTGLPFVFATWMARDGFAVGDLPNRLQIAKRNGLAHVEQIIRDHAAGWPRELAEQYLTSYLRFDIGPRQLEAIDRFHDLAARLGIIKSPLQPLEVLATSNYSSL
jgi:chorismate dehydratase